MKEKNRRSYYKTVTFLRTLSISLRILILQSSIKIIRISSNYGSKGIDFGLYASAEAIPFKQTIIVADFTCSE
jgi:hypothetical protein